MNAFCCPEGGGSFVVLVNEEKLIRPGDERTHSTNQKADPQKLLSS
jgi:hypothetical protein